ncbi:hypothetical protein AACH10_23735 [Ideonella sp. DXS22W]|uniref:Tetratricopeptide repeat protein n=1 Tax=Pseudaquabacterium inlustre TaxID=2984192 RepID=A0ABU9CN91_9BURK
MTRRLITRWAHTATALALAGALLALGGCAPMTVTGAAPADPPWADALFAAPARPPQAAEALALSPAMRAYLPQLRAAGFDGTGPARALVDALATRSGLRLEYEAQTTRTAAQAFDDRAGNCLSLVLMTAAFARELGVSVVFNEALVEAQWRREGGLVLRSGHVNLTLGTPVRRAGWRVGTDESLMVDFLPGVDLRGLRTRPIDERRVLAMYLNNRAAETLATGDVAGAYWWVREALRQDGGYLAARNTLGVVYQRAGQVALAGEVFEQLLALQPDDGSALGNLALVREAQGRLADAAQLRARRDALEPLAAQALRELSPAKLAWLKARKGTAPVVP